MLGLRVVVTRMIQIMADTGCQQDTDIFFADLLMQFTQMNHAVHHLCNAEAVTEIMEWVVSIVLLNC